MKLFKNKLIHQRNIFLVIILLVFGSSIKAQEASTRGEVYDFDIGDTFHKEFWGYAAKYWYENYTNYTILDKYYSADEDTVFFVRDIALMEHSYGAEQWEYEYYIDTIFYDSLNLLIPDASVYVDPDYYNGRIINQTYSLVTWDDWGYEEIIDRYVVGCGHAYNWYEFSDSEEGYAHAVEQILYYKKGNEEWGIPHVVSTPESLNIENNILVFPNPSDGQINISLGKKIEDPYQFSLYGITGVLIKTYLLYQESTSLYFNDLESGCYFYTIQEEKGMIKSKGKIIIQ